MTFAGLSDPSKPCAAAILRTKSGREGQPLRVNRRAPAPPTGSELGQAGPSVGATGETVEVTQGHLEIARSVTRRMAA